jgi:hypothetical protein
MPSKTPKLDGLVTWFEANVPYDKRDHDCAKNALRWYLANTCVDSIMDNLKRREVAQLIYDGEPPHDLSYDKAMEDEILSLLEDVDYDELQDAIKEFYAEGTDADKRYD